MTQTPNFQLNQWSGDDYVRRTDFHADNAKIDAALAAAGNCRIVTGSYTGTGKYGSSNAKTLSFDGQPLVIVIQAGDGRRFAVLLNGCTGGNAVSVGSGDQINVSWTDTSVSWYNSEKSSIQMNDLGITYHYTALLSA